MRQRWEIPEGLRVFPDGSWRVGDLHVVHPRSLRYFKSHLVREGEAVYIVDGVQRMPVAVEGPAFEATGLVLDGDRQEVRLVLDDGTVEVVNEGDLGMNRDSGRFEARVRRGAFSAVLARGPHQVLLEHLEEEGGRFFLRVGERRIGVRT